MTCCPAPRLTWGLSGCPRQRAAIFCTSCRQVHRREVPIHEARLVRDEIKAEMAGRATA